MQSIIAAILLSSLLAVFTSCANYVLIRKSTCHDIVDDLAKCQEVK